MARSGTRAWLRSSSAASGSPLRSLPPQTVRSAAGVLSEGPTAAAVASKYTLRLATLEDAPVLRQLIARSIHELGAAHYSREQIEGALQGAFGVDTSLIRDGTYFVAVTGGDEIAACGGWGRRRTLFGSSSRADRDDSCLDPRTEAARIRAFFVDPRHARQGLGRALLERCEAEAIRAGFSALELMATLPGIEFYRSCGYVAAPAIAHPLPGGLDLPLVPMRKQLRPGGPATGA
jgi:GNAT superfamily N-acetyltransferase